MSTSQRARISERVARFPESQDTSTTRVYLPDGESSSSNSASLKRNSKSSIGGESTVVTIIEGLPSEISLVTTNHSRRCFVDWSKLSNSNNALSLCHNLNIPNASADEIRFIEFFQSFGLTTAEHLAARFHWQCQRPLRALLAVIHELDRNYSVRSAKRTRPLSAAASSRKRSSGA